MLGRRAGLCWVRVARSLYCGPISLRSHFFEGYGACGYTGLEWAHTCVRALVLACGRAYVRMRFSACGRVFYA